MPRALFLSPHFDDVVYSCGGTLATLAARGWSTTLCTVFARAIVRAPGDVDEMAVRAAEDDAAARILGASGVERLDVPEARHRGYEGVAGPYGPFAESDRVERPLQAFMGERMPAYDLVFAPQAIGRHVDHRRLRDAVLMHPGDAAKIVWYRDAPPVLDEPEHLPDWAIGRVFSATLAASLTESALAAKLDACAAYATQLDADFGGEAAMRARLAEFARHEALGTESSACERFRARPTLANDVADLPPSMRRPLPTP